MPSRTPSVVRAVRADLRTLEERKPGISKSGLAAAALAMARELDDRENTASGMAACAGRLDSYLAELRLVARRAREQPTGPPEKPQDGVDEIATRRASRRAGS